MLLELPVIRYPCTACASLTHLTSECFYQLAADFYPCFRCYDLGHLPMTCFVASTTSPPDQCTRCLQLGHLASACYMFVDPQTLQW